MGIMTSLNGILKYSTPRELRFLSNSFRGILPRWECNVHNLIVPLPRKLGRTVFSSYRLTVILDLWRMFVIADMEVHRIRQSFFGVFYPNCVIEIHLDRVIFADFRGLDTFGQCVLDIARM